MRVALVHDALNQLGGAEYVLRSLHNSFPHAPIYTLVDNGSVTPQLFPRADIRTSFLQRIPGGVSHYKWYLPAHPTAFEHFDLSEYDVVISDSSSFAKGVITRPETIHLCYCHTPTRYLWHDTHNYTEDLNHSQIVKRVLPAFLTRLRMWDQLAAQRVDRFIANSTETSRRIKKYYKRDARVVHPPVRWRDFHVDTNTENYYLILGRMRPYKRFDLAIEAFNRLGLTLVVVGDGEEYPRLKKMAGPNIIFLRHVSDAQKVKLFARAQAFIHPQEEDFGIVAVESMSAGRPVIAYKKGGALETVVPGLTGQFFAEQTVDSLVDAVRAFEPRDYDPVEIRRYAWRFDESHFVKQIWQILMEERRARAQLPLPLESFDASVFSHSSQQ